MSSSTTELKQRAEARMKELEAQLAEFKADAASTSREAADRAELELQTLKQAAQEGWENLKDETAAKVNDVLDKKN